MGKFTNLGFLKEGEMLSIEPGVAIITGRNLRKNYVKCDRCGEHVYKGALPKHRCHGKKAPS